MVFLAGRSKKNLVSRKRSFKLWKREFHVCCSLKYPGSSCGRELAHHDAVSGHIIAKKILHPSKTTNLLMDSYDIYSKFVRVALTALREGYSHKA